MLETIYKFNKMKKEFYHLVGDEKELRWAFDNMIPNLSGNPYQSFLMCIAARPKRLTEEERKEYGISGSDGVMLREEVIAPRGPKKEWTYENFVQHVYRYECDKRGMVTKTDFPYPEKCLSVMLHFDPADEVKVSNAILSYGQQIQAETIDAQYKAVRDGYTDGLKAQVEKLAGLSRKNKSLHAGIAFKMPDGKHLYTTVKTFIHFDFDIRKDLLNNSYAVDEAEVVIHGCGNRLFGKGNFYIIRTKGGYHVLVKRTSLKNAADYLKKHNEEDLYNGFRLKKEDGFNPLKAFIGSVEEYYSFTFENEEKIKEQIFVPLPGTIQYGDFIPYVTNKEDF